MSSSLAGSQVVVIFNIMVLQGYAPTSNAEEAEVERFYEDLQDLLELTPQKDVLFNIEDWNAKVGSQVSTCNGGYSGDGGSIPGSGRSPGGGNGNLLQYSCLKTSWTEGPGRLQSMVLQRVRHN